MVFMGKGVGSFFWAGLGHYLVNQASSRRQGLTKRTDSLVQGVDPAVETQFHRLSVSPDDLLADGDFTVRRKR
jgi:hypothetical protein